MVDRNSYNKKNKIIIFVVAFFFLLSINMINVDDNSFDYIAKSDVNSVTDIKINKSSLKMKVDDKVKLSVLLTPVNVKTNKLEWNSSNSSVVTVDNNGNVKAIGVGEADIVVYLKNNISIKDKCHVIVSEGVFVTNLKFEKNSVDVEEGVTGRLKVSMTPSNASSKDLLWSSSDNSILKISNSGRIRALRQGTVIVTVVSKKNSNIKDSCEVTVKEKKVLVKKIKLNVNSKALNYGDSYNLKLKFFPSNAINKEVIYVSSNPSLVTVDKKGKIKVILNRNGKAVVTVYSKDNKEVKDRVVISVKVKLKKLATVVPEKELVVIKPKEDNKNRDIYGARGFCVVHYKDDVYLYAALINKTASKGSIKVYKKVKNSFKLVNNIFKKNSYFGYATDMMYVPSDEKIYITTSSNKKTRNFNVVDSFKKNLKFDDNYFYSYNNKNKYSGGSIGYDIISNIFYYAKNSAYYIGDDNMKIIHKYLKADGKYIRNKKGGISILSSSSGITAYDNKILIIRYNSNVSEEKSTVDTPRNAIDIYDGKTGEYIGTNILKLGNDRYEVKGIDYYGDDYFAIYYYEKGKYTSYIKKIKLKI